MRSVSNALTASKCSATTGGSSVMTLFGRVWLGMVWSFLGCHIHVQSAGGATPWLALETVIPAAVASRYSLSCQNSGRHSLSDWCADVSKQLDAVHDSGQFTRVLL